MVKKITNNEFISYCKENRPKTYSYGKTIYTGTHNKIIVTCDYHGDFKITAKIFKYGGCCPECNKNNSLKSSKFDLFLKKSIAAHGDRYDYLIEGNDFRMRDKIKIGCRIHGVFNQVASAHAAGHGCQKCAKAASIKNRSITVADFEKRIQKVHGDKYKLVDSSFSGMGNSCILNCKTHGDFTIKANNLIRGQGCSKCGNERKIKYYSKDYILEKISSRVGDNYDYLLPIDNIRITDKIDIKCRKCKEIFNQSIRSHIYNNDGCPNCSVTGFNKLKDGFLYVTIFESQSKSFIKHGITNKTHKERALSQMRSSKIPYEITMAYSVLVSGSDAVNVEGNVKSTFKGKYVSKKYLPDGHTETLPLSDFNTLVDFIKKEISILGY